MRSKKIISCMAAALMLIELLPLSLKTVKAEETLKIIPKGEPVVSTVNGKKIYKLDVEGSIKGVNSTISKDIEEAIKINNVNGTVQNVNFEHNGKTYKGALTLDKEKSAMSFKDLTDQIQKPITFQCMFNDLMFSVHRNDNGGEGLRPDDDNMPKILNLGDGNTTGDLTSFIKIKDKYGNMVYKKPLQIDTSHTGLFCQNDEKNNSRYENFTMTYYYRFFKIPDANANSGAFKGTQITSSTINRVACEYKGEVKQIKDTTQTNNKYSGQSIAGTQFVMLYEDVPISANKQSVINKANEAIRMADIAHSTTGKLPPGIIANSPTPGYFIWENHQMAGYQLASKKLTFTANGATIYPTLTPVMTMEQLEWSYGKSFIDNVEANNNPDVKLILRRAPRDSDFTGDEGMQKRITKNSQLYVDSNKKPYIAYKNGMYCMRYVYQTVVGFATIQANYNAMIEKISYEPNFVYTGTLTCEEVNDHDPQITASCPTSQKTAETLTIPVQLKGSVFNYKIGDKPKVTKLTLKLNKILPKGFTEDKASYEKEEIYSENGEKAGIEHTFNVNIPAKNREFTQDFKAVIEATFSDGNTKIAETTCSNKSYKGEVEPPVNPPTSSNAPKASISSNDVTIAFDDTSIGLMGEDNDKDDKLSYEFSILYGEDHEAHAQGDEAFPKSSADNLDNPFGEAKVISFSETGKYILKLTVSDGQSSDTVEKEITVIDAIPKVSISSRGTYKENRKFSTNIYKSESGASKLTIDWNKTEWLISCDRNIENLKTLAKHEFITEDSKKFMKIVGDIRSVDFVSKSKGKYNVKCTIYNSVNKSASDEISIDVKEDIEPTVKFVKPKEIFRDPKVRDENGKAVATFILTDDGTKENGSYSIDGDVIGKRVWLCTFDTDNDKSYEYITTDAYTGKLLDKKQYETWYVYDLNCNDDTSTFWKKNLGDNRHWRPIGTIEDVKKLDFDSINTGNLSEVKLHSNHVGSYNFELIVKEEFGERQETINEFVSIKDRKSKSSLNPKNLVRN